MGRFSTHNTAVDRFARIENDAHSKSKLELQRQYREELENQIRVDTQHRKIEKQLGVAPTGWKDPEKASNRLVHLLPHDIFKGRGNKYKPADNDIFGVRDPQTQPKSVTFQNDPSTNSATTENVPTTWQRPTSTSSPSINKSIQRPTLMSETAFDMPAPSQIPTLSNAALSPLVLPNSAELLSNSAIMNRPLPLQLTTGNLSSSDVQNRTYHSQYESTALSNLIPYSPTPTQPLNMQLANDSVPSPDSDPVIMKLRLDHQAERLKNLENRAESLPFRSLQISRTSPKPAVLGDSDSFSRPAAETQTDKSRKRESSFHRPKSRALTEIPLKLSESKIRLPKEVSLSKKCELDDSQKHKLKKPTKKSKTTNSSSKSFTIAPNTPEEALLHKAVKDLRSFANAEKEEIDRTEQRIRLGRVGNNNTATQVVTSHSHNETQPQKSIENKQVQPQPTAVQKVRRSLTPPLHVQKRSMQSFPGISLPNGPAYVKRPSIANASNIRDFLLLKNTVPDKKTKSHTLSKSYPNIPVSNKALESEQIALMIRQERALQAMREGAIERKERYNYNIYKPRLKRTLIGRPLTPDEKYRHRDLDIDYLARKNRFRLRRMHDWILPCTPVRIPSPVIVY